MTARKPQINMQVPPDFKRLIDDHVEASTESLQRLSLIGLWHLLVIGPTERMAIARLYAADARDGYPLVKRATAELEEQAAKMSDLGQAAVDALGRHAKAPADRKRGTGRAG